MPVKRVFRRRTPLGYSRPATDRHPLYGTGSTPVAHPNLDMLLDHLLNLAKTHLAARGAFFPFGAVVRGTDKLEMFAAYTGEEHPAPQELIKLMIGGFHAEAKAGNIAASGLCVDVRTVPPGSTSKTDAICAWLEHRNGEAVDVYLPYQKNAKGDFEYGQLFANRGGHGVFGSTPGAV
jgi:hypothetical protein